MAVSGNPESMDQIPQLLHDATFLSFRWDESLCQIEIDFRGLRCDESGSTIDRPITLRLQNVFGVAAFAKVPCCLNGKKPDARPTLLVTTNQLKDWYESSDFSLWINSRHGRLEFDTALQVDWLLGSQDDDAIVTIHFGASMGSLQILCDQLMVHDNGQVMSIGQWGEEYRNWWKAWQDHWDSRDDSEGSHPTQFETAIPAGPDVLPATLPDPIDRIVFPDDLAAPSELLQPIRDYLEGLQQRDWVRVVRAWPDLDAPDEKSRAELLADQHAAGPWVYAREIDQWWNEENYACVTVRGVEYEPEIEDEPAAILETVVNYELRRWEGRWILWSWSQGWVPYGSAPALDGRQPWHDEWSLLSHLSDKDRDLATGS